MAKDLLAVSDALDRAEGINKGIDALVSLLFIAKDDDSISARAIGELLYSIQQDMAKRLLDARAGLRNAQ